MMSDYSAVAPPQNFSQSSAFAAALQRAKQIAAKINPNLASEGGTKRPLEDGSGMNTSEPETKKVASEGSRGNSGSSAAVAAAAQAAAVAARVAAAAAAGIQGLGVPGLALGPVTNEDIRVPDKMVGLIIGRGGEQISRLQTESGCKIQMAPDSGGLPERVCTLTGNAQAISRAKELIGTIVAQRSRTEGTGGARLDDMNMGGGPPNVAHVEIMVPGPKVGLIIGKGGETIKQLQEKSGAKMVVIQDGPSQENEKPLRISGEPQKVEHAKALVYELIAEKEIQRRDNEAGRGRGRGGGFDRMGSGGGGGPRGDYQDRGGPGRGWDNNGRGPGDRNAEKAEATFSVPAAKCGVIIGRGGETIKQINQQTGAHCELDRRPPANPAEKTFVIRGSPDQIEQAKRLIAEKLGMPGPGGPNGGPQGQYPIGGGPQYPMGGPAQNWSGPGYQQPWQNPHPTDPSNHPNQYPSNQVPVNPQTGQPDYSQQWIEYYRSLGMHREADLIEQQTKANKAGMTAQAPQGTAGTGQGAAQAQGAGQVAAVGAAQNGQPDYSAQWAEYYRSIGKIKEAEAIEVSMKAKQQVGGGTGQPTSGQPGAAGPQPTATANPYPQNPYGYPTGGFYGGAPGGPQPGQPTPQPGAPQFGGYPNYAAYAGQPDNQ